MRLICYWLAIAALAVFLASSFPPSAFAQATDNEQDASVEDDEDEQVDPADDIFLPSEEIKADSEISFPSDI